MEKCVPVAKLHFNRADVVAVFGIIKVIVYFLRNFHFRQKMSEFCACHFHLEKEPAKRELLLDGCYFIVQNG